MLPQPPHDGLRDPLVPGRAMTPNEKYAAPACQLLTGLAKYGPITGTAVADLPAAYVAEWTPPVEQARAVPPRVVVPPGRADVAVSYVNARINGIAEDLAARKPGGRNTAIYTAALKVGSTLGVARSTPGAEHAADAWTDEDAEDALMVAAERNGYIANHSASAARSAIRSGLRNGLRSPRPLPDFSSRPAAQTEARSAAEANDRVAAAQAVDAYHSGTAQGNGGASAELLRDAGSAAQENQSGEHCGHTVAGDWRDAIMRNEREAWRPRVASPEGELSAAPEDRAAEIGG